MSTPTVKKKIKIWAQGTSNAQKEAGRVSRARKGVVAASVAKIVRKAGSISELLTDDDQEENLRVIREAKRATHKIYDQAQKRLIDVPDTKSRLAAVVLDLTYREGTPIQRSVSASRSFTDFGTLLAKMRASPAALAAFQALGGNLSDIIEAKSTVTDS